MSLILGHNPMEGMPGGAAGARAGGQPGAGGAGGQQPPPGSIQVSAEEMAAISRLQDLGFPKGRAAEAYFACDKNEEMAANFLFESGVEDESDALQNAINASTNPVPVE
jgi:ubiquitin